METKTAAFITLGCKINQYETEAIRREVLELGYEEVRASAPAACQGAAAASADCSGS